MRRLGWLALFVGAANVGYGAAGLLLRVEPAEYSFATHIVAGLACIAAARLASA
jgi:hypothetical protein